MEKNRRKFLEAMDRVTIKYFKDKVPLYYIYLTALAFILNYIFSQFMGKNFNYYIVFNRAAILRGQVWRMVTFPFTSPYGANISGIFSTMIQLYLLWTIFNLIAARKGVARLSSYLVLTYLVTLIGGFIFGTANFFSLSTCMLFLIGILIPEFTIYFNFLIPIKGWFIPFLSFLFITVQILSGNWNSLLMFIVLVFVFIDDINYSIRNISFFKRAKKQVVEKVQVKKKSHNHKCTVCGKTDLDDPHMTFRFCSKCQGAFEYCEDHLRNHEHRTNIVDIKDKLKKE